MVEAARLEQCSLAELRRFVHQVSLCLKYTPLSLWPSIAVPMVRLSAALAQRRSKLVVIVSGKGFGLEPLSLGKLVD